MGSISAEECPGDEADGDQDPGHDEHDVEAGALMAACRIESHGAQYRPSSVGIVGPVRDPFSKSRHPRAARRWRPAVIVAPVVFAVTMAAVGCGESEPPEIPLANDGQADPVLVEGAAIYSARCATCHGDDGGGGRGPKLADARVVDAYPDIADQLEVVMAGRRAMPRFEGELTPAEIEAVVRYTREVL